MILCHGVFFPCFVVTFRSNLLLSNICSTNHAWWCSCLSHTYMLMVSLILLSALKFLLNFLMNLLAALEWWILLILFGCKRISYYCLGSNLFSRAKSSPVCLVACTLINFGTVSSIISKARARQLRVELQAITLDSLSISNYLHKIRTIMDVLALIGDHVPFSHHIEVILEGLTS